jgi:hypothetical protein
MVAVASENFKISVQETFTKKKYIFLEALEVVSAQKPDRKVSHK